MYATFDDTEIHISFCSHFVRSFCSSSLAWFGIRHLNPLWQRSQAGRDRSNLQYAQSVCAYHLMEAENKTSEYCYSVFGPLA